MDDSFGDRMKQYEGIECARRFIPLLPVCARLDGKGFHNYTKNFKRPYDPDFSELMIDTTKYLVEETNAKIGYTQSDEISLVFYSDDYNSQIFFDGKIQKMISVLCSMATSYFNENRNMIGCNLKPANFDCRVWQMPNLVEAANVFLWREQDATKNSISMAAHEFFSNKELHGKNGSEKQDMLFKQKGINWNNYPAFFKRGTFIQRYTTLRSFTTNEIEKLPAKHEARKNPNLKISRTEIRKLDMPPFNTVANRVEVIFNGKTPITNNKD